MNTGYKLKKSIESPIGCCKAGTLGKNDGHGNVWFEGQYFREEMCDVHPDWFEKVVEPERIEVDVFPSSGTDCKNGMWAYTYAASNPISQDKFPAIKAAIENVLNPEPKEKDTPSRDWEVLEIKSFDGAIARKVLKHYDNQIGNKGFEYRFVWDGDKDAFGYYEDFILSGSNSIHSVRRLSDNTVWTVGEETTSDARYLYKPIKRFFEKEGVMYAQFDEGHGSNDGCLGLNALKKLPPKPQPLFVTEKMNIGDVICPPQKLIINGIEYVQSKSTNH